MDVATAIGQMAIVSFPGDEWNREIESLFTKYCTGGLIHFQENISKDRLKLEELNKTALEAGYASSGLLPFISVDEEGGKVSRLKGIIGSFPTAMETAGKGDVYAAYLSLSAKVKELGFNTAWAPVLDINSNPQNPVIGDRSFGAAANTVKAGGQEAIRAFRSSGLLSCGKHFPGHGDTFVDSHLSLPVQETTLEVLRARELIPFAGAVKEGVDFIMTAHILFSAVDKEMPVTFSKIFLQNILREELGYEGLIVTDDLNMGAVKQNYSLEERIELSVNAGADILLLRDSSDGIREFFKTFRKLVENGKVLEKRVFESAERIKKLKEKKL